MIRVLRVARRGAMKARIQAGAQIDALILTAPEQVRAPLRKLTSKQQIRACAALRPGRSATRPRPSRPRSGFWAAAGRRSKRKSTTSTRSWPHWSPPPLPGLLALPGVGVETAGQLLVTAGDNRGRLRSEASFARLCGAAPVPVSPGRTDRHRLHRGGDWQANSALWRIALVRMGCHQPTKDYVARRTAEGKTKTEIMRCLKRYIAREVFPICSLPRLAARPAPSSRERVRWSSRQVGIQVLMLSQNQRCACAAGRQRRRCKQGQ